MEMYGFRRRRGALKSLRARTSWVLASALLLLAAANANAGPVGYQIETGVFDGGYLRWGSDPSPDYIIFFNHFNVTDLHNFITDISVNWGDGLGGTAPGIAAIWSDPVGSGSPANAQLLTTLNVDIPGGGGWATYDVPDTLVTDSFFVGVAWQNQYAGIRAAAPNSAGAYLQSYFAISSSVGDITGGNTFYPLTWYNLGIRATGTESVPDPGSTLLLLGMSLTGMGVWRHRRQ